MITIIEDLPNREYHERKGLSASGIPEIQKSPAHYAEYMARPFDSTVSVGSLVHLLALEPNKFDSTYAIVGDRRTKEGKAQYEKALAEGKLVVKQDDVEQAKTIAYAIQSNKDFGHYLTAGKNEVSIFTLDSYYNVPLKIRPDILIEDKGLIIDVKTVNRGISKFAIENLVRSKGWDIQAAFYRYVAKAALKKDFQFINLFVEASAPYGIRAMKLNQASMDAAEKEVIEAIGIYKDSIALGVWNNYSPDIEEMNIRKYKTEEELFG